MTAQVAPRQVNPVQRLIDELAQLTMELCGANVAAQNAFDDCRRLLATARALDGLCQMLGTTGNYPGVVSPNERPAALQTAARQLLSELKNNVDWQHPLPGLEPEFFRNQQRRSRALTIALRRTSFARLLQTFRDSRASPAWKRSAYACLTVVVRAALHELEQSPSQVPAADLAAHALGDPETLVGTLLSGVGSTRTGIKLTMEMLAVYGRRAVVRFASDAQRAERAAVRILNHWCRAWAVPRNVRGDLTRQMRAGDISGLRATTRTHIRGSADQAIQALGVVQLLLLASSPTPPHGTEWLKRGLDLASAAHDTVRLIGAGARWGVRQFGVSTASFSRGGLRTALSLLKASSEVLGVGLSLFGAVLTIAGGVGQWSEGWHDGEPLMVVVGGLNVASGVLVVIGTISAAAAPIAIPCSIAFALGASVAQQFQHHDPAPKQVFDHLVRSLHAHENPTHGIRRLSRGRIVMRLRAVEQAARGWHDWDLRTHYEQRGSGAETDRVNGRLNRQRLRRLGFDAATTANMIPISGG